MIKYETNKGEKMEMSLFDKLHEARRIAFNTWLDDPNNKEKLAVLEAIEALLYK